METPWNQNGLNLKTWIARELRALVRKDSRSRKPLRASSMVHYLFLSTVTRFPELWSIRRDFYTQATCEVIEIWKRLGGEEDEGRISFACPANEVGAMVERLEAGGHGRSLLPHLARLNYLLGLGEVEIAEIMDLPERSVRRQLASLLKENSTRH